MKRILLCLICIVLIVGGILCFGAFATDQEPTLDIVGKALELESSVGVSFAVPTDPANGADVKLLVWTSPRTDSYTYGTQSVVLEPTDTAEVDSVDCMIFTYSALAAKQMTDDLYVRAYTEVKGKAYYSAVVKYSVLQYAYNMLAKSESESSNELKATLTSLLQYGANAQRLFEYRLDRLADATYYQISVVDGYLAADLCQEGLYLDESEVTLTAQEANAEGVPFHHWEDPFGEEVGREMTLTVTVNAASAVYTAIYQEDRPTASKVAVSVVNGRVADASEDGTYEIGATVELVANENEDACFAYWKNAAGEILSEDATYTVTVGDGVETYTAVYATPYSYFYFESYSATEVKIGYDSLAGNLPENVIVPRIGEGKTVVALADDLFKGQTTVKTVELPSTIKVLPSKAFRDCSNLQSLSMDRCTSLTSIPTECFYNCQKLVTIALPSSIQSIGNQAFRKCAKLSAFTIGANVTSIGAYAFSDCTLLTSIVFENPNGWAANGQALESTDLADPATALQKWKYYFEEVWTRS